MSQSIPNYFRALPVRKTLPKALPAPTSTESLPTQILTAATDCFYLLFRLTLRLSNIVGAEEIQGRSSGVAVIRPVNLLQTSTSIQRKNKPSARWEATSEFDPLLPLMTGRFGVDQLDDDTVLVEAARRVTFTMLQERSVVSESFNTLRREDTAVTATPTISPTAAANPIEVHSRSCMYCLA